MKLWLVFIFSLNVFASIPEKQITEGIEKKLDALASANSWKDFSRKNPNLFPALDKTSHKTTVRVEKEELNINGDSYTLGVGYRQTFIHAPIEKVKKILNNPGLFKSLYGLDADANIDNLSKVDEGKGFKARIYKSVPLIPDQDYILSYTDRSEDKLWIQRAKLLKDNEHFALRDNLKVLEPADGGTIFREVSVIYALRWYVRFFGPSVREVMTKELAKITEAVKCLAESDKEISNENASACWHTAEQFKL